MTKLEQVTSAILTEAYKTGGLAIPVGVAKAMAREAVKVLLEPNEAMIQRGWELIRGNLRPDEIFPHMIEVVLDEKPE
jgi:hypothetical protein